MAIVVVLTFNGHGVLVQLLEETLPNR